MYVSFHRKIFFLLTLVSDFDQSVKAGFEVQGACLAVIDLHFSLAQLTLIKTVK